MRHAAFITVFLIACASASTTPTGAAKAPPGGKLLNPSLEDGSPVMMGYDSHHPDCFTFPASGKESEKVECPEGAMERLHECRGSKLYLKGDGSGCVCVPISGDDATDLPCPDGIETK